MTRPLTALHDRVLTPGERRAATLGVFAVLIVVLLASGMTRSAPRVPPPPRRAAVPSSTSGPVAAQDARRVAREFLSGYLAYAYRGARADAIADAPQSLIAALQRSRPRAGVRHARIPRILALVLARDSRGRPVIDATLNDAGIVNYTIGLLLTRRTGRLLVTEVESR